jgi:hypothetical protein
VRYVDSDGQAWIVEQQAIFDERWTPERVAEVFGRALVKVRREGEYDSHWMRVPAEWKNDLVMAALLTQVREFERRVR